MSGYTIQHIPESQQAQAVKELFRVLRPAASLCVITDVRLTRWHRGLVFSARAVRKVLKTLGLVRPPLGSAIQGDVTKQPYPLYFVSRDLAWWRELGTGLTDQCSVECIRLFQRNEYQHIFGDSTRWARVIRAVETCFPRFLARASAYCLVELRKDSVTRNVASGC